MATFTFPTTMGLGGVGGPPWASNAPAYFNGSSWVRNPSTTATPQPDTTLLENITADITNLKAEAIKAAASEKAARTQAAGFLREVEAYKNIGAIAEENATLEGAAGEIKQLQANRALMRTIGSQRASIAAAGFANAGTSLDLYKSSMQQGYLTDQLIRVQTAVTQGGYFQEAAAARAEAAGAQATSDAALELAQGEAAAGALATANMTKQTVALNDYFKTTRPRGLSSLDQLVTSTISGDINQPPEFNMGNVFGGINPVDWGPAPPRYASSGYGSLPLGRTF